jgi:hypothetical protein
MKTTTKILLSLAGIAMAILLPAILSAFFYIQMPGIVLLFLVAWMIYLLIYVWRLPAYKFLKINENNSNDVFGMKTELLRLVVPQNYIPEDSGKAAKAVELNSLLESIDADDLSELKKIRIEIEQSLGIAIDSTKFSRHLLEVFSPSKYKGKPEYVNEMTRICSDIARCGSNIAAIEDTVINAQKRIDHWNSLAPSYKKRMILTFMWGVIGSAALWFLDALIKQYIVFFN